MMSAIALKLCWHGGCTTDRSGLFESGDIEDAIGTPNNISGFTPNFSKVMLHTSPSSSSLGFTMMEDMMEDNIVVLVLN